MKTRQIFGLFLSAIFNIAVFATNISYAHDVVSVEVKVESYLSSGPGVSILRQVDAIYPPIAKAARVSGAVMVEVAIAGTGKVTSAKILSGHPLLKEASLAAARQWKFTPVSSGDAAEQITGTITFDFIITEVRKELEKALQEILNNPDSPKAHVRLAYSYMDNGRKDEAIKEFEGVIQLKPDYDETIYRDLAGLYYPNDSYRLEVYQRGLKIFPDSVLLMKGLGKELTDTGRYSEAIGMYQNALVIKPEDTELLCLTAQVYQNLLRFEESLEFLQRALLINSNHHIAKEKAGFAYLQLGRLDDAEEYLKQSVSLSAHTASALEYLGDVYQQRGNIEMAVQTWEKAIPSAYEASQRARIEAKLKVYLK
jgi:TonB family protein